MYSCVWRRLSTADTRRALPRHRVFQRRHGVRNDRELHAKCHARESVLRVEPMRGRWRSFARATLPLARASGLYDTNSKSQGHNVLLLVIICRQTL